MGTLTFPLGTPSNNDQGVLGSKRSVRAVVTPSTSYATGGETIPLASLGLKVINNVFVLAGNAMLNDFSGVNPGYSVRLGGTAEVPKLLLYDTSATEVAAASNLSARPIGLMFIGT